MNNPSTYISRLYVNAFAMAGLIIILFTSHTSTFAQGTEPQKYATVYFMRETGYMGKAGAFKVFVDDTYICKISDKRYISTTVVPGKHSVSAQYYGTSLKPGAEQLYFEAEADKTYYFVVTQVTHAMVNDIFCEEITENSANQKMKYLRADPDCR